VNGIDSSREAIGNRDQSVNHCIQPAPERNGPALSVTLPSNTCPFTMQRLFVHLGTCPPSVLSRSECLHVVQMSRISYKAARMDQRIYTYVIDCNRFIDHLPMQKVVLRPDPVFMVVSVYSAGSGDSQETRNCCKTLGLSRRLYGSTDT
jgi:hypothetical protein